MSTGLVIPPSSHFLGSFSNLIKSNYPANDPELSRVWIVFPSKRAKLFFYYNFAKPFKRPIYLPLVFSFEEFVNYTYGELAEEPFSSAKDFLLELAFAKFMVERGENFYHAFNWASNFLEVFEELEKESKVPENLLYPPEGLPKIAVNFFEKLKNYYLDFKKFKQTIKISTFTEKLVELEKLLAEKGKEFFRLKKVKAVWFVGFAALRRAELNLFNSVRSCLADTHFVFSAESLEDPLIQKTAKELGLSLKKLDEKFFKKRIKTRVFTYQTHNLHIQVKEALNLLKEPIKSPEDVCIVLPQSTTLFPLISELKTHPRISEVNITLMCPARVLSIIQLFTKVFQAQRGFKDETYFTSDYLEILKNPLVKGILKDAVFKVEKVLRKKGFNRIKLVEIESLTELGEEEVLKLKELHAVLIKPWESVTNLKSAADALETALNYFKSEFESTLKNQHWEGIYLRNFVYSVETELIPSLKEDFLELSLKKEDVIRVLERYLLNLSMPFSGEPLKGLQVMGFMETRLLNFKKLVVLDLNEGILPPSPDINPLLTEEIKRYLKIPSYRNELWWYYFQGLLRSSEEAHLFYVFSENAKGEDFKEPSRFVQFLKWEAEKKGLSLEEKSFNISIAPTLAKEKIKKEKKHRDFIKRLLLQTEVSRYFIETYLRCQVAFYLRYILRVEPPLKMGMEKSDVGNFLHEFFRRLFKGWEGKEVSVETFLASTSPEKVWNSLWSKFEFERKMNKLVHFFSQKIGQKAIENYLRYLKSLQSSGVTGFKVLGVERTLLCEEKFFEEEENGFFVKLKGIIDFLIKRKAGYDKYLILDYKSNPYMSSGRTKVKKFVENKVTVKEEPLSSYEVWESLGSAFQLMFYFYLFLKNKDYFLDNTKGFYAINAGFVTPTDFKAPEKFIFAEKKKNFPAIYAYFEKDFPNFIESIFRHMLDTDGFYFAPDESTCKYCEFKTPCKNLKHLL